MTSGSFRHDVRMRIQLAPSNGVEVLTCLIGSCAAEMSIFAGANSHEVRMVWAQADQARGSYDAEPSSLIKCRINC